MIDLRCGRWEDVLANVGEVDSLICDPPYSERNHVGADTVAGTDATVVRDRPGGRKYETTRRDLSYTSWTEADVHAFVLSWSPRTRGWMVCMTSHDLVPAYEDAFRGAGRYVFAPLPCYSPGSRTRLQADGPACWTVWLVVARPRTAAAARWGTLPGGYVFRPERDMDRVGGKPVALMRAIVRDYSRPGDLVCDPCGGGFTTALAAVIEGRRAVSAEMDEATFLRGKARIEGGWVPTMFPTGPGTHQNQQMSVFRGDVARGGV